MTDEKKQTSKEPRGCLFRLLRLGLLGLALLIGLAVWFNGPGIRWLGPKIAMHFLEKAGFEGDFKISGSLYEGLKIHDLALRSDGSIARLKIDHLEADYVLSEIINGEIRGITADGIHLEMQLLESEDKSKEPMNFQQLNKMLSRVREQLMPLDLDLKDMNVRIDKNGDRLLELEDVELRHESGEDSFDLALGKATDASGRVISTQQTEILWQKDGLKLDQFDLLPGLGVQDFEVKLPEDGEVEARSRIRLEDAMLDVVVDAGLKRAQVELAEGNLDLKKSLDGLGLKIPLTGEIDSLTMEVTDPYPNWREGSMKATASLTDISYASWDIPKLDVDLTLDQDGKLTAKLDGESMGSGFSISATSEIGDKALDAGIAAFSLIEGNLNIQNADALLQSLQQKFEWKIDVSSFPDSSLSGNWTLNLDDGFQSVTAKLNLDARDPDVLPIHLNAGFSDSQLSVQSLTIEGLDISGTYDFGRQSYQGKNPFENFKTETLRPWTEGLGLEWPESGVLNGTWEGSGNVSEKAHRGKLSGFSVEWKAPDRPLVSGRGEIEYKWPGEISINDWSIKSEGQQIDLDASIRESLLTLNAFKWFDGEAEIAAGSGKVSLPKDFTELKSWIAKDEGVLDFSLKSKVVALSKLKPWVSGLEQLHPGATGEVQIELGGGFSAPEISASVWLKNLKSIDQPSLPSADVVMNLQTKDGLAKADAEILAGDYQPASFQASMPFFPKKWVEQPESFQTEKITGKLLLPDLDLSQMTKWIPGAEKVSGTLKGHAEISGSINKPEISADINLSHGHLQMKNPAIPDLTGVNFRLTSDMKQLELKGSVDDLSGGNLNINGTMDFDLEAGLDASKLNLQVRARGLPVVRNEFLIMRSHVDLSIVGPLESAQISGEIGIIDSIFYKDVALIPIGKPFLEPTPANLPAVDVAGEVGDKVPAALRNWTADILVKTVSPILIRGNLGKGAIDAEIRVNGNLGDPIPNGSVSLRKAVIRLPFAHLQVNKALLTFNEETRFDPSIEIRAESNPRPYEVDIYAYGRASNPQLALVSQPPLPKEEIMTLLATGTTSSGLEDSQLAASRATQFFIEELRRGRFLFGKQLRPILGLLDDVNFSIAEPDPYTSATFNTATIKLSKRWSVSAGVSEEGDQRIMGTWKFSFE